MKDKTPPLWIALAAFLWATDAIFRVPTLYQIPAITIVLIEHAIAFAFILTALLVLRRKKPGFFRTLFRLNRAEWLSAAVIGILGSATATVLFTMSFQYVSPSVAIFLQKSQPILTVFFAFLILKEKPKKRFYPWALLALLGGFFLSFPDLNFGFLNTLVADPRALGALLALGAATLWAFSTVAGKTLVSHQSFGLAVFWRFAFGLLTLLVIQLNFEIFPRTAPLLGVLPSLFYMSLVPGLFSMTLYYIGLKKTTASTATFMELVFPISAIFINAIFLKERLTGIQALAAAVMLAALTQIPKHSTTNSNTDSTAGGKK